MAARTDLRASTGRHGRALQFPGVPNVWTQPIRNRLDMLSTGIKTPVGIKILGPDLTVIQEIGREIERTLQQVPGTRSVYAERVAQGYFTDIDIDRDAIARYGLRIEDVQDVIQSALGGENVTQTIEGRERYPVNVRYASDFRQDLTALERVLVKAPTGVRLPLGQLAHIAISPGPAMIRDEDAQLAGYVYVDTATRDIGGYVTNARAAIEREVTLPPGYTLQWTGQYEFQVRARERLKLLLPIVFFIIFMLLYMTFHSASEAVDRHALGGLRDDRRSHPAVAARLQLLGGRVGRLHRAVRRRGADRRRHGGVPPRSAGQTSWLREARSPLQTSARRRSMDRSCGCDRS